MYNVKSENGVAPEVMQKMKSNCYLYILNTDIFSDDELKRRVYEESSNHRKEKTDRLRNEKDKLLSLGASLLLSYASMVHGEDFRHYSVNENGKPYICDSRFQFSISHSGNAVILAVAGYDVGCDVELIEKADIKVAKRFFTKNEYYDIISSDNPDEMFYRIWTLKESYVKATGEGMKTPFNSFYIDFNREHPSLGPYSFAESRILPEYFISVCGKCDLISLDVNIVTPDEITKEVLC